MTKNEALRAIDESPVRPGQLWQHGKTQGLYTVVAVGLDEPTLAPVVVYAGHDGVVWSRKLDVFLGAKDGAPRFVRRVEIDGVLGFQVDGVTVETLEKAVMTFRGQA